MNSRLTGAGEQCYLASETNLVYMIFDLLTTA